ncbi:hypothetical protein ACOSP7_019421 [Xanthoceras sorbifolium]|uniref:RanBP2-type domain-containing protein n=1 Tax=Xanthoceras sorbifolium TaxID=99658 RepID=A0ABQ8I2N9_9ROSI|nr:hypothetical protein JRO89_XS05G0216100 [Xanthoceras sorbifolium]
MHKLFRTSHRYLYSNLKPNPEFLTPISHLHSPTKALDPNSKIGFIVNELEDLQSSKPSNQRNAKSSSETKEMSDSIGPGDGNESTVQISHPWPEWVDLMECLMKSGYFDADGNPFDNKSNELGSKEANCIRTACLNFARDRYSLIRYFSRKDIQIIVGCGCPSIDRKVVNSGKRLRAHVGIDEGNVCSSCNLRGNCERAYVKAHEDEGGRTVDVMRILLTYGLDPITGTVENKPCQNKLAKESVRRMLKEMVEYGAKEPDSNLPNAESSKGNLLVQGHLSPKGNGLLNVPMKQGDWHCPKCDFLNFAKNIRCLRCDGLFQDRLKQLRENQDNLPLKKGDWICDKCNFLNFAKNTRCLQCKENPPKRQLNPGEWECESCNYINFRRNMVCLKCDHRRPKTEIAVKTSAQLDADGGYRNRGSIETKGRSAGRDRQRQNRVAGMWKFVEEENENDNQSHSWDEDSGFVDFPIAGGKSALSQNPHKREKWKLEILERNRNTAGTRETDDSKSADSLRMLDSLESTDDEEVAGWFGHNK